MVPPQLTSTGSFELEGNKRPPMTHHVLIHDPLHRAAPIPLLPGAYGCPGAGCRGSRVSGLHRRKIAIGRGQLRVAVCLGSGESLAFLGVGGSGLGPPKKIL